MKKSLFISLFCLFTFAVFGQNKTDIPEKRNRIYFDFVNVISPFQTIGMGYEYVINNAKSVEVELGYIYNSWFTRDIRGAKIKSSYKSTVNVDDEGRTYVGLQGVYHLDFIDRNGAFDIDSKFTYIGNYKRTKNRFGLYGLYGKEFFLGGGIILDFNVGIGWQYSKISIDSEAYNLFQNATLTNTGIVGINADGDFTNFDGVFSLKIKKEF